MCERERERVLLGKPEGRRPLARLRRRCEECIKIDVKKQKRRVVNWIDLA